jgi:hypothetical protein
MQRPANGRGTGEREAMSEAQTRARPRAKARPGAQQAASETGAAPAHAGSPTRLGPHYAAGPAVGLGTPVQTKLAIGQTGDAYEQEASAVANRVTSGATLAPSSISTVAPGALARASAAEEKKPEQKPVQKAEASKPEEKKPEQKVAQKAEASTPTLEQKKPEPTPVQKAESSGTKLEEKKPEQKSVQRAEAAPTRPEEKKPEKIPVQKAEAPTPKPEEKKPEQKVAQKAEAPTPKPEEKKPEQMPVQKAEEQTPASGGGYGSRHAARGASMAQAADEAVAHAGPGRPMNEQTRDTLETRMHRDLSGVRIHDDDAAHEAARDLNARAFTHGHDIWLGRGESDSDLGLMAHEATHVVQQNGGTGVQRQLIQRRLHPGPTLAARSGAWDEASGPLREDKPARSLGEHSVISTPTENTANGGTPATPTTGDSGIPQPEIPTPESVQAAPGNQLMVQRQEGGGGGKETKQPLLIDELPIPKFKLEDPKVTGKVPKENFVLPPKRQRPTGKQSQTNVWRDEIGKSTTFKSNINDKLRTKKGIIRDKTAKTGISDASASDPEGKIFFFAIGSTQQYVIGTSQELADQLVIPRWGPSSKPTPLDVDHVLEWQLGGPGDINNLRLLDASANRSAGATIATRIDNTITDALKNKGGEKASKEDLDPDAARSKYAITYKKVTPVKDPEGADVRWEKDQIEKAEPLDKLNSLNADQIDAAHLLGESTRLIIFPLQSGGKKREIADWDSNEKAKSKFSFAPESWIKGYTLKSVTYEPGKGGELHGEVFTKYMQDKGLVPRKNVRWGLSELAELPFTTRIDAKSLLPSMRFAEYGLLSPIEFQDVLIDDRRGLLARGKLKPSLPIFKNLELDITIEGEDIWLSKTFTKDDFALPGPIQVTAASLTLAIGSGGLKAEGDVFLRVERLGTGKLSARVSTSRGFELHGAFDFDSDIFKPATVHVGYADGKFSGSGELGIPEGKVQGIKSASIKAAFDDDRINASGSVKPSIPGIEQGDLSMSYDPANGLVIAGSLQLRKDIPGISGGSVQATVAKKPGADRYIVQAGGQATPKIPGISTTLAVTYDDGAFDVTGTASYEKGMLKGSVTVGATNRPVGQDGQPAGTPGAHADTITLYGGGSVTIKLAPWLQGTAGIKLKPNGEIEVSGQIGLPKSLDIFPEKKLEKNIFTIGIDIPILGVAAAGQRVGIFANISGGLDLSAGIGPAQLQQLSLGITYNPAHEEQTHVTGGATLHIPAHAGLRLFVRGSLGAGIPLVSAEAGLEIGGQLGLEGALDAGIQVDWTPAKGLKLDAFGEISVEPKLKFDITGFVLVQLDLWLTTIELYSKRWQLAAFEYGSGLRLGVKFPIHYEEGKPFDISLSDVQFQLPDINPSQILPDLMKRIV